MNSVFLNGEFVDPDRAVVPVTDRGLLFGDSVYEVIPAYQGVPFRGEQHLARLQRSLDAIRLANPYTTPQWLQILDQLCRNHTATDFALYLQVTRGNYPRRAHSIPADSAPTVIAFATPIPARDPAIASDGISAVTLTDARWHHCDIKSTNLLPNVLALAEAGEQGCHDAILVRDGLAHEGTASNLFAVLDDTLITPPDSLSLLPGVTRDLVLELANEAGLATARREVSIDELRRASEIWLTSSTREVVAVTRLDGKPIGNGLPGPKWRHIDRLYQAAKQRSHSRGDHDHDR